MLKKIRIIFNHKEVLRNLVIKNLKARYANSLLGILWTMLNPFLLILAVSFIFTEIIKVNIRNFYLFIISGMLPWFFFANSLQEASTSIVSNVSLLKQFSLPRELIPIASVLVNFFLLIIGFLITLPFFIVFNPKIIFVLPWLILILLSHLSFTIGIALFLSSMYVRFRDIGQFLGVFLLFWLWLTPVFYSIDMVPDKYRILFKINPLIPYINLYQGILFDIKLFNLKLIFFVLSLSIISFCAGLAIFIKQEPYFLKRI
jgi:ABC-2 type transport system permease protein